MDSCTIEDPECLYCRTALHEVDHEHDHFPIPKRNGGKDVHCACVGCHTRKDRYRLDSRWGPTAMFLAMNGLWDKASTDERLLLAKMITLSSDSLRENQPLPYSVNDPEVQTIVEAALKEIGKMELGKMRRVRKSR